MILNNKQTLDNFLNTNKIPYFYNPGMLGDVIYSIPFCLACIGIYSKNDLTNGKKFNLILDTLIKRNPNVQQTHQSLLSLKELLQTQPYFNQIQCFKGRVDFGNLFKAFDLGGIRKKYVDMAKGDIQLRYNHLYRTLKHFELNDPWIVLPKNEKYNFANNKIIVFRTPRYRNNRTNYQGLKKYSDKIIFIGAKSDYETFVRQNLFKPQYQETTSFMQVANILNNCAFCVGNQTSYFALAEALKIPRLCQMASDVPDVIPKGNYANDFVCTEDLNICLELYYKEFIK